MRAGNSVSITQALALSTALLVPNVRWCQIPWELTTVECVARCTATSGGGCRDAFPTADEPMCEDKGSSACETREHSTAASCGTIPLSDPTDDSEPSGRAYVLGDAAGGVVVRDQGILIIDVSQLETLVPPPVRDEPFWRPFERAPDPEVRPPLFAWTSVRLARAPPRA